MPARGAADSCEASGWVELAVRLPADAAEIAADALGAIAPGGAALEPRVAPLPGCGGEDGGYAAAREGALVRAFFPAPLPARERRVLRRRLAALPLGAPLPRLRYRRADGRDWSTAWRERFGPLRFGRLAVRPPWAPAEGAAAAEVVLDPGRAFGTGQHPTTALCLRLIGERPPEGGAALDVGCGSGILALAAVRLGAARADALDTDPEAVAAARANARRNGLADRVRVAAGSLGARWPRAAWGDAPEEAYGLVAANISSAAARALLPDAARALLPGGALVAGGFMRGSGRGLAAAARALGLEDVALRRDGEWCALRAAKPERR